MDRAAVDRTVANKRAEAMGGTTTQSGVGTTQSDVGTPTQSGGRTTTQGLGGTAGQGGERPTGVSDGGSGGVSAGQDGGNDPGGSDGESSNSWVIYLLDDGIKTISPTLDNLPTQTPASAESEGHETAALVLTSASSTSHTPEQTAKGMGVINSSLVSTGTTIKPIGPSETGSSSSPDAGNEAVGHDARDGKTSDWTPHMSFAAPSSIPRMTPASLIRSSICYAGSPLSSSPSPSIGLSLEVLNTRDPFSDSDPKADNHLDSPVSSTDFIDVCEISTNLNPFADPPASVARAGHAFNDDADRLSAVSSNMTLPRSEEAEVGLAL
ncbi:hypothetical protein EW146_g9024 [Bondarzewia mesenterica]|uniref:Uncharacterized protein n=1 Tax=Bondarzewia mesenterica TaxID=1095465 RepID=A0A4S4L9W4_9AGAM|nr:hypothetical protein EW146_g9024 [Bondarzewia mesenterica]